MPLEESTPPENNIVLMVKLSTFGTDRLKDILSLVTFCIIIFTLCLFQFSLINAPYSIFNCMQPIRSLNLKLYISIFIVILN